jgi:hypothetical protein
LFKTRAKFDYFQGAVWNYAAKGGQTFDILGQFFDKTAPGFGGGAGAGALGCPAGLSTVVTAKEINLQFLLKILDYFIKCLYNYV